MKRSVAALWGILLAIAILGVALYALLHYERPQQGTANSPAASIGTVLYESSAAAPLVRLTVSNAASHYVLVTQADGSYALEGFDSAWLSHQQLARLAGAAGRLTGQRLQELPQDLAPFGLTAPVALVVAQFGEETVALSVGGQVPGGTAHYAMVAGTDALLLLDGAEIFLYSALDFLNLQVVQTSLPEAALPSYVKLGGTLRETPIVLSAPQEGEPAALAGMPSGMRIRSHHNRDIRYETVAQPLSALLSLTADSAVYYNPSSEDLAAFGLLQPYSTARFQWTEPDATPRECNLIVSRPQSGTVFLIREGIPVVFSASVDKLPWLSLQYQDIVSRFLLLPRLADVSAVTVTVHGATEQYTVNLHADNTLQATDSSGKSMDGERFKTFYQCLIGLPAEQYTTQQPAPDAATLLTVTYHYKDGRAADIVSLLQGPTLQAYLSINREIEFLTKEKYATIIAENQLRLTTDTEILPLY